MLNGGDFTQAVYRFDLSDDSRTTLALVGADINASNIAQLAAAGGDLVSRLGIPVGAELTPIGTVRLRIVEDHVFVSYSDDTSASPFILARESIP
ncbi:MAG: hypothetical protein ACOC1F_13145 [Myxococcota bacterium]